MIQRTDTETRVTRQKSRMWVELGVVTLLILGFIGYLLPAADDLKDWVIVAVMSALAIILAVIGIRRRPVCTIRDAEVVWGFQGGPTWSLPRHDIGAVRVFRNVFVGVLFYDHQGRVLNQALFAYFSPKELRQAFESEGFTLR